MRILAGITFWMCAFLVVYAYLLYPVLLFLVYSLSQIKRDWAYLSHRFDRRAPSISDNGLTPVSVIIPAYNEEAHLEEALATLRTLDYADDQLEIIIASDGSTDRTNEILYRVTDPSIRTILFPGRRGKASILNAAVQQARHEIIVFSDASTQLSADAISKLVRHFRDPRVGVVCGALSFIRSDESRQTEGLYWKYEVMLRLMESRLGATLTASGAIYAIRRECYEPLETDALIDDLLIPMRARRKGFKVLYDPEATATEFAASGVAGEALRRTRLATGSFRALPELLRTPMPGFTFLAFVSHKLLRWIFPFLLIGLLISNGCLLNNALYQILFLGQVLFYVWACLGVLFRHRLQQIPYALTAYFMLAMNLAFLKGFYRCFWTRKEGAWERVS